MLECVFFNCFFKEINMWINIRCLRIRVVFSPAPDRYTHIHTHIQRERERERGLHKILAKYYTSIQIGVIPTQQNNGWLGWGQVIRALMRMIKRRRGLWVCVIQLNRGK